ARGDDADSVLARTVALYNADVGVADLPFDFFAQLVERLAAPFQERRQRHAADTRAGPQEYLLGAVVTDNLRLYMSRIDIKVPAEMDAEAQAVEESAGADHGLLGRRFARNVGERIGRISDDQQHR